MRKQRIFEISKERYVRFKQYCKRNHIDTVIEDCTTYKRFYCLMDDEELRKAKEFCDSRYKPEAKTEKAEEKCNREVICIIIEETRILY